MTPTVYKQDKQTTKMSKTGAEKNCSSKQENEDRTRMVRTDQVQAQTRKLRRNKSENRANKEPKP